MILKVIKNDPTAPIDCYLCFEPKPTLLGHNKDPSNSTSELVHLVCQECFRQMQKPECGICRQKIVEKKAMIQPEYRHERTSLLHDMEAGAPRSAVIGSLRDALLEGAEARAQRILENNSLRGDGYSRADLLRDALPIGFDDRRPGSLMSRLMGGW